MGGIANRSVKKEMVVERVEMVVEKTMRQQLWEFQSQQKNKRLPQLQ